MEPGDYGNKRVLIVDDQKDIHDAFVEMLNPTLVERSTDELAAAFVSEDDRAFLPAFELSHATSGEEACQIVQAARASNYPIAVAYIDIRMPPGIDGIETIQRVCQIDSAIEIVIMTAYSDRALPEIIQDLEMLHKVLYLRKPFAREEIQQITLSLVEKWNVGQVLTKNRQQLADSHQRLEAVLDATGDAIALYDPAGFLLFANRGYGELFDLPVSELRNMSLDVLTARFKERFQIPDLSQLVGNFVFGDGGGLIEETASGQMTKRRLFHRSTAPVLDSQGDLMGDLHVYRDVSNGIEIEQMKVEVQRLRADLETTRAFAGIVGTSPAMRQVYTLMQRAAESDITVLLMGESGTGKELIAKSLHFNSARKAGPFLAINCAAIPEMLIESELFGHEQGAFTGATRQRIGAFERAKGGTIFLDETGDMQPAMQAKMLRVLQERDFRRVGGAATIPVDIRVIVATNKDLGAAVKAGVFREDLFHRIAAFPIAIPPLRKRRSDIPLLASHFLEKHAKRNSKPISGFSIASLQLLLQHEWPGNVRELENAIERAVLLEETDVLRVSNLPPQLLFLGASQGDPSPPLTVRPLVQVERQALLHALEAAANNVTQAARSLGIDRTTLYRKLKKYDLLTKP